MPPTRIFLVRHGHTESNSAGPQAPLAGWTDVALSEAGRREADGLRTRLGGRGGWSAVYSSSSGRALETAHRAVDPSWHAQIRVLDDLREINCGTLDGKPLDAIKRHHAELWERNELKNDPGFRWPGGESYAELRERALTVLDRIADESPGERVLVFTHAGIVSQIMGHLHGLIPAAWDRYRPRTCSITEVLWGKTRAAVRFDDAGPA
jgi:broad specificity phosphatase PhoE